jgi:DNA-binding LacI/PurR family transcriptional regulator
VALIGFDDIWAAECTSPALSTVRQDTRAAAEALVDTLIRIKNHDDVEDRIIPTQLMLRDTA